MSEIDIPLDQIRRDENQPRKEFCETALRELGMSLLVRQIVAIIVVLCNGHYILLDGERRYRAAMLVGMKSLRAQVLDEMPSPAQLKLLQLIVNTQRCDLNHVELYTSYNEIMHSEKLNATQLAQKLSISKSKIARVLSLDRFTDEERRLLQRYQASSVNSYSMARMDDDSRAKAFEHLKEGTLTPEVIKKLSERPKMKSQSDSPAQKNIVFSLPDSAIRLTSGESLNLDDAIERLSKVIVELKKARKQGLDVKTASLVLRDRAGSGEQNGEDRI